MFRRGDFKAGVKNPVMGRGAGASARWSRTAALSWVVLAATLATLSWLHPHLGALLDFEHGSVLDDERFYSLHRQYLMVVTIQWAAAVTHLVTLLIVPDNRSLA